MKTQFGFLKLSRVVTPLFLFFFLTSCGGGGGDTPPPPPPVADNPPTVSIDLPTNGATVSDMVSVEVTASDDRGVSKVELFVDNVLSSFMTSAPYDFSWDSTAVADGAHILKVVATDTNNQTATSQITITSDNGPVTFRIDKHLLTPVAVYKDELPTALITYQIEMQLPEGWTAFVRFNRNTFVVGNHDLVNIPIEDDDGDGVWEVTFATGIPEPTIESRDGKTGYVNIHIFLLDENGMEVFINSPNGASSRTYLGVVDRSINSTLSATSSPSIMRTRSAIFLRADDFQGTLQDVPRVTRTVYSVYDDRFDYLIVSNIGWSYGTGPRGGGINPASFGSAGRLKARAWMNDSHSHIGAIHEILHHRLFFFNDPALNMTVGDLRGVHMGACSDIGPVSIGRFLTDNGDGTSTSGELRTADGGPLSQLALRMAEISAWWNGFLPSFTPFRCVTDESVDVWSSEPISNSLISTIDENAVISVYGNPPLSYATGQKDYNGILLVISQDGFPDAATADYFTALGDHLAGTSAGYMTSKFFASPGSFNWTTRGEAILSFPTVP
ncbi:hypothetical protein IID26_00075 [Patescibacteria group bacterium]|nr:hypothetical protein [Patescibacteria group bacterium]